MRRSSCSGSSVDGLLSGTLTETTSPAARRWLFGSGEPLTLHPALGEQALGRRPRADLLEAGEEAVQALARGLQRNLDFDFSQASSERFAPKECA